MGDLVVDERDHSTPEGQAVEPAPANPFAPSPKLSIRHLMVWGVCVAVYCSASQSIEGFGEPAPIGENVIFAANDALISGTGLAGLVLLVARKRRGLGYPRHGGEWLWTIAGVCAALELAVGLLMLAARSELVLMLVFLVGYMGILGLVYLMAILRCEERRWKAVFLLVLVTGVGVPIMTALMVRSYSVSTAGNWIMIATAGRALLILVTIVAVAWIGRRQRCPWPHWAGVALKCWQSASLLVSYILYFAIS